MKLLVTGGAGFIGSHLVRLLITKNHDVTVIDNLSTGSLSHLPDNGFSFWKADVRDVKVREKIIAGQFDGIVHLAAQTMVGSSIENPMFDAQENIIGSLNILEAAKTINSRVVFASTAAAYGDVGIEDLPIKENRGIAPMSFYGLTKTTVEKYLQLYHTLFSLDYVALRFANVYGERQGDRGEGGVISIFAKRIAMDQPITIFGDGTQTRDFIYAGDIASGILAALTTSHANTVYNLSTSTETSLNTLVNLCGKVAGKDVTTIFADKKPADIYRSALDNQKAIKGLVWQPKVSLTEGMARTYRYFYRQRTS